MARSHKILLLKPSFRGSHYGITAIPQQGLGYLSECLCQSNIDNRVVDMELGYDLSKLKMKIEEYKPDLIGISLWTFRYKETYRLINDLKKSFPKISILAGGPHLSTLRERVLEECLGIDYGIAGEGEKTLVEFCKGDIYLSEIKGMFYRDADRNIVYSGDRPYITNLDEIGFPKYERFELEKYSKAVSIVTSRGCPYRCIFCPIIYTSGGRYRARSARSVGDEIEYWHKKGRREFIITDDNFTLIKDRVSEICGELERRELDGLIISLPNGIRADRVDRSLLSRMKEVGFKQIAFGVEGGNNRILKNLRKNEKIEQIEQAISDACELDYMVTLFFLLGSPGETEKDVYDSLRLALKYPVYDVRFYNLIPFPGTELFEWVKNNDYFLMGQDRFIDEVLGNASHWVNEPLFETPELSREKRKELYQKVNETVKWHTLPVKRKFHRKSVAEKFERLGLPRPVSLLFAEIYFSKFFQKGFLQNRYLISLKSKMVGS